MTHTATSHLGNYCVYILGSDGVISFLEALFVSIREHSPTIPVLIIPYNEELDETRVLCKRFGFSIHQDAAYSALERIGSNVFGSSPYPNHHRLFRRLAAFWGPYETFLYLDADICVLAPLEPLFDVFQASGSCFASFDNDHDRVYLPGPLRDRMINDHGSVGFNSGHFVSRRGILELTDFENLARDASLLEASFQDKADQGFLNFVIDEKRIDQVRFPDVMPTLADKQWANQKLEKRAGTWFLRGQSSVGNEKRLVLIHYSGCGRPSWGMPNRWIYYRYLLHGRSFWCRQRVLAHSMFRHYWGPVAKRLVSTRITLGRLRRWMLGTHGE